MGQVRATIQAGVCGFVTEVVAACDDDQHVAFAISSPCEKVRSLAERLPAVDAYSEIQEGAAGVLLATARECLTGCCAGCVVPAGLFKAMQVAAGLALPHAIGIELERA
jgi:hypothetical protein